MTGYVGMSFISYIIIIIQSCSYFNNKPQQIIYPGF